MNNSEETIVRGSEQPTAPTVATPENNSWKKVSIGGVSGILVGAGAILGAEALAHAQTTEADTNDDHQQPAGHASVASSHDGLSFDAAFAAARAEVGPGGVFYWNGGVYGTYYEEEWAAMSAEERLAFTQSVQPAVRPQAISAEQLAEMGATPVAETSVEASSETETPSEPEDPDVQLIDDNSSADNDVHVVGTGQIEGHSAVALDISGNGDPDVVVIDVDDSDSLTDPDLVVDNQGNYATIGELNQEYGQPAGGSEEDSSLGDGFHETSLSSDIDASLPDYSNDADVGALI